jgi:glutaredoxin
MKVNRGYRSVPTILFPDGSVLVEPSTRDLAQKVAALPGNDIMLYRRHACPGCSRHERLGKSCSECARLTRVLDALEVPYKILNVDQDPEADARIRPQLQAQRGLPAVVFPDGTILLQPSVAEVADKLGV